MSRFSTYLVRPEVEAKELAGEAEIPSFSLLIPAHVSLTNALRTRALKKIDHDVVQAKLCLY